MKLIDEVVVQNNLVRFYDGIDFDAVVNHPKDGSAGFIIYFIDNWSDEVRKYERDLKLRSILTGEKYKKFKSESIDNNWVCIYQTQGITQLVYESIREKILVGVLPDHNWIKHPHTLNAIKIENKKADD